MAFVRAILLAYEKHGKSPRRALAAAGVRAEDVENVDARIDAGQMEKLSSSAMQELDDEALGWFSRRLPWGSYGLLCRASLGSANLGVALKRWARHHLLLTEDVRFVLDGEVLALEEGVDLGPLREFCLLTLLRSVHGYACWLVDSRLPLVEVTFPFEPPRHAAMYRYLFPGPVRFGAPKASLRFDARSLALAPARDEEAMAQMLRHALRLTVRQYRNDRLLVERVRSWLVGRANGTTTADALATALKLSVRSLHRQLAREGATLQAIKDDVRQHRALDLLARTSLSMKQVAARVGFVNDKSFARAFKAWTGLTPSEHRETVRVSGARAARSAEAR